MKDSIEQRAKEDRRLNELLSYDIMDTQAEADYDSITKLASIICNVPICLISLLDSNRQWFKSKVGLSANETARDISFCQYAIEQSEIFEVCDTFNDNRFKDNVLVTSSPFIRFYAGMPLRTQNGYNLGTLCIIDSKPNKLDATKRMALITLAKQVVSNFDLRKRNKELELLNDKVMNLSKAKDEFLSNMSHELRTPLNAIFGFTEILSTSQLDPEQSENVSIIKNSVEVLISIINDILDFSKIESGKLAIENNPFNIRDIIKGIYELLKLKAVSKNIALSITVENSIPKYINGDRIRLNQILINLIGNAIKFTDQGIVQVFVKLTETIDEHIHVTYSVKDTGIGIEEDKLGRIFTRFEQADNSTTRKYGGTGLGLAISKSLVELQGGKLGIKSVYGKGSEFFFSIKYPKLQEKEIKKLDCEIANKKGLKKPDFGSTRVLLAEDVEVNAKLIKKVVQGTGIIIDVAENGRICIEKFKSNKYDIILMDLQMPVMNGFDATLYIRDQLKSDVPIIAISANVNEVEIKKCFKLGMNDYLSKPFKVDDLLGAICKVKRMKQEDKSRSNSINSKRSDSFRLSTNDESTKMPKKSIFNKSVKDESLNFMNDRKNIKMIKIIPNLNSNYNITKSRRTFKKNQKEMSCVLAAFPPLPKEVFEPININTLKEFSLDDLEFEKEMIETFLKDMPGYFKDLEHQIDLGDMQCIYRAAHKIKSPLSYFGLNNLRSKIISIEEFSKKSDINEIINVFKSCKNQILQNINELLNSNL